MKNLKLIVLSAAISIGLLYLSVANAAVPTLSSVTSTDLPKIVKEFSANFIHRSATPASSIDKTILPFVGFEVGVVAGITDIPEVNQLVSTEDISQFPHAGVYAAGSFPYGAGLEIRWIPEKTLSDVTFEYFSLAGKWTITDVFFEWLPVNVATRVHFSNTDVAYKQSLNNSSTGNVAVDVTVGFDNSSWGMDLYASRQFLGMIEPYAGVGFIKAEGTLFITGNATATFFDTSISQTATQSATEEPSTAHLFAGVELHLLVMNFGAEWSNSFGTNTYTGKFTFTF